MQNPSIKYILKLSIPIFFANLAIPLVGIIDTGLMGNLGNLSYLSATSVAANLFSVIFWSFGFLRMGTVGLVSQAYGKEDYTEIFNIVVRNLVFVLLISLILILLQSYIFNLSVGIFNLSDTTREFYQDYFQIRIYSAPGELTLYIITGLFVGLQKTKISTTFLIYTFWYLNKMSKINININELIDLNKLKNIFNINLNIFIRTILLTFSFFWFTYLGSQIGEDYIAANAVLINLVFLSAFILDAYAFSTEGMVGYSLGKKDISLFKKIVKNSFILSTLTGLIISIIYFFINKHVITLMSDIETIRNLSSSYAVWLILMPLISSFCYQFDGIFIGASQTKELRNAMIFSVFSYLLMSLYLTKLMGNTGIWISLCLFMVLRALSLFYYLDRIYLRFREVK